MNRSGAVWVWCMLVCLLVPAAAEAQLGQPVLDFEFQVDGGALTLGWRKESGPITYGATIYASYSPGGPIIVEQYVPPAWSVEGIQRPSVRYPVVPPGTYYVIVLLGAGPPTPALNGAWTRIDIGAGCAAAPGVPAFWDADDGDASQVDLQWAENEDGCPAEWFVMEAGSAPGLSNIAVFPVQGFSLRAHPPVGTYYLRLRAANRFGGSPPSDEVVLAVEGCNLPGPPLGFSATVTGQTVRVSWSPPAIAGNTLIGYLLQAGLEGNPFAVTQVELPAHITELTATDVPPGTYLLQMAARTSCPQFTGFPTPVITVVVP